MKQALLIDSLPRAYNKRRCYRLKLINSIYDIRRAAKELCRTLKYMLLKHGSFSLDSTHAYS